MNVSELLKREEGKTLEFKRDLSSPLNILKTLVAFSNTDGGILLVGVKDNGTVAGIPGLPALEFIGPDGVAHGWLLLNARKEPVIWATTQYVYAFGPLKRFGNLLVPNWATTNSGLVRYEMVSLTGSNERPDLSLFAPPAEMGSGVD